MKTILVIEDDEIMRDLLHLKLGGAGYHVLLAKDAVVAANAVMKGRPDLVLMDIDMPHLNGLQLAQAMKSDPETARIPVIFVTGRTDAEAEAMQLGAAGFFAKPLRADDLLAKLAALLRL
jgi:CheY-like chemotaxis protein